MTAPRLVVGGVLVDREQRVMAARRSRPADLAGRWEFPGGKVEPGEAPTVALARELREELGITVQVHAELENAVLAPDGARDGTWPIDERHVMRVWFCSLVAGEPTPGTDHDEVRWLVPAELPELDWLPADRPIAARLAGR